MCHPCQYPFLYSVDLDLTRCCPHILITFYNNNNLITHYLAIFCLIYIVYKADEFPSKSAALESDPRMFRGYNC